MKQLYSLILLTTLFFAQPVLGQSVFPGNWSVKVRLEISSDNINSTLTDFPVAVILDNTNFDFSAAQADGSDVRFTTADGITLLTFERERHDNTGEQGVYWVKIPSVSSTENTVFYLYYGNSEATDASSTDGSVYAGGNRGAVLHMEHELVGSEWLIQDSRYDNKGVKNGQVSPLQVTGLIGHAQQFDGMNDLVTINHSTGERGINISDALTLSAWVKPQIETMLLDAVPAATAAYSLRKLRDAYTGNAIRVRRSSDNAESEIGFLNDQLDVNELETFIGSGNGYVVTWYDQSGNSEHVTQATAGNQPMIVENGSVLISDGKPMVRFNNDFLAGTVNMGSQNPDATLNSVWRQTSDGNSEVPVFIGDNTNLNGLSIGYYYEYISGSRPSYYRDNNIRLWEWNGYNYTDGFNSDLKLQTGTYLNNETSSQMQVYINGTPPASLTNDAGKLDVGTGYATTPITIGANQNGTDYLRDAYVAEIIIYTKVLASNERQAMEQNQQKCYGFINAVIAGKGRNAYQLELCSGEYRAYINNQVITAPATFGHYQHVVMTYDLVNLKLYVDGTEVASQALSGAISTNANNLLVGNKYLGEIDELRLANIARPADRILADYHSGTDGLLIFDRSGFTVEPPGIQISGETFNLNITGARDGSGNLLSGPINVSVNSDQPDGEVYNQAVDFTGGSATVPVTLTHVATHNLTVGVALITNPVIVEVEVIAEDLSGFSLNITPAGEQTAGEQFTLFISNATDKFGDPLEDYKNVIITSSEQGELFNASRYFTEGNTSRNLTLNVAAGHVLTVTVEGVTGSETINVQVNTGALSTIAFFTPERAITAGGTSDIITIQLQDAYGNQALSSGTTTVNLTSDLEGTFRNEADDDDITFITIAEGLSEGSFRYTSTVGGTHILTGSDASTVDPLFSGMQILTVDPAAAASIVFTTAERFITAGGTSDIITIQLQDVYNNVARSSGETTVNLSSDLAGTFRNEADNANITFVTIADGLSEASFRYTSTVGGTHVLTGTDAATVDPPIVGIQNLTVDPAAAASIVFTTAEKTITAGGTSDAITIQLRDVHGNVAKSSGETTINLISDLTGTFHIIIDDAGITSVTIAEGQSNASFLFSSTIAGVHVLSATDAAIVDPLTVGTQNLAVDPAAAASIVFTTAERVISTGGISEIITVQLQDVYDNETSSSGMTTVNLSSNLTGTFRNEANDADITFVTIADGQSEGNFRYTSTVTGIHTLSAADAAIVDPLTIGTQNLTVVGVFVFSVSGDWNTGTNWEGGNVPPVDSRVIINSGIIAGIDSDNITVLFLDINGTINYSTGSSLTVKNHGRITVENGGQLLAGEGMLAIEANARLLIKPGGRLTSTGTLTNSAGTGGLIIESDADASGSVIQNSQDVQATVQRYVRGGVSQIVSSPVSGMTVGQFVLNSANDISFNTALQAHAMTHYDEALVPIGGWAPYYTSSQHDVLIDPGKSYVVRKRTNGVLSFSGTLVPSLDSYSLTRATNGWHSVGNPYPSALLVKGNDGFITKNSAYFDENYAALYIYDPDYPTAYRIINNNGATLPEGKYITQDYLQSGQGFLVKAPVGGSSVNFTGMKAHEPAITFFRSKSSNSWPTIILNVSTESKEATTVITFNGNMTRGLDVTYDAGLFGGDPLFKLYSKLADGNDEVNFAIQCLPDHGFEDMVIPIGLDFSEGGEVKFSTDILTLPTGARAILEDRVLDIFTDLEQEDYIVTLGENTSGAGRFYIHTDMLITSDEDMIPDAGKDEIIIYSYGKEVFILGEIRESNFATLFDTSGKLLKTIKLENGARNSFRVDEIERGIYLIRLSGKENEMSRRVFIE
jgi:hypothetical protein